MEISFRALGVLMYAQATGINPTIENLTSEATEGREAVRTALKELESHGLILRKVEKINDRFVRSAKLPEDLVGLIQELRVSGTLIQPTELINPNNLVDITSKESTRFAREEEEMPYDFFGSTSTNEWEEDRLKAQAEKKREYEEAKNKLRAKRKEDREVKYRRHKSHKSWTSSDIAYEFADRLLDHWNIAPWSVVQTRFIPALANMRKANNTDGEIEYLMLDLFFQAVSFEKYDSADILWKMFIKRAPDLAVQATRMVRSKDVTAAAKEAAKKSWDWMAE